VEDIRPIDVFVHKPDDFKRHAARGRLSYLSFAFLNVATASSLTRIRDGFSAANREKREAMARGDRESAAFKRPFFYAYGLRTNQFLMSATNLDYFEFYRHADNAMVWETSNRDSRVWAWDSYLNDVQRVLKRELGLHTGVYVKPHRGAPVQRTLAAISRGAELLYWYTYGPDYWKGDAFSSDPDALRLTSRAAHLLGTAEDALFEAKLANEPRVAVVRPETTQAWMSLEKTPEELAANENGKWVYTALQHAHVPVDPLDEKFLTSLDLSRYAVIYVSGTHVARATYQALEHYVTRGGVLVTSGRGMAYDETGFAFDAGKRLLGLKSRGSLEQWCNVPPYGAGQLDSLAACEHPHSLVEAEGQPPQSLFVGREVLQPKAGVRVLARYEDGAVAATESPLGAGKVVVLGYFAGLEYAAPVMKPGFEMRRDFDAVRRSVLVGPALAAGKPPVELSEALVEATLLKSTAPKTWAVTLANWAYVDDTDRPDWSGLAKHVRHAPLRDVGLIVHGVTPARVRSSASGRTLTFERFDDGIRLALPELAEGDVLLLDEP
jgi:hypothetical protein